MQNQNSNEPNFQGYPADTYNSGACGPDGANGGAYWPSQSAEDTCGVQFWSDQVCHKFTDFINPDFVFLTPWFP